MSRSSNSLRSTDVITTPIKLKYTSSYTCVEDAGMRVLTGVNGPVTVTGSVSQNTLNYHSVKQLYYSNYLTGSYAVSASAYDNALQSTAASGTLDADVRYFPTESNAIVRILSIPRSVFGEKVSRRGFKMVSAEYCILDDGNGNLIDIQTNSLYVDLEYYLPEGYDWYVFQGGGGVHVGNIIYPQGMVIITNPDYLEIFPFPPTAANDWATFSAYATPKRFNILANDENGTGLIDETTVVLSGGDVSYFTNNLDGTVTLNTTTPGTYKTYYTVKALIPGSCPVISNQASIEVVVYPATTTTTTTTTTSTTSTTTTSAPTTTTTTTTTSTTSTSTTLPGQTTTSTTTTTTTSEPTTTTTTTSTTSTTTTPAPPCVTYTNFTLDAGSEGTLVTSSAGVYIYAKAGDTAQTSVAHGTYSLAPGCEPDSLSCQVFLTSFNNQTGSIVVTLNALEGQTPSSYNANIEKKGIGGTSTTITVLQTGSYGVTLTGNFGAVGTGGNVSGTSYVRII